jgi:hypothetical protein
MAEVSAARITSLIWLGMVVVACGLAYSSCTTYVAPNEVGILESRLVAPTGIREKMYPGGRLYFLLLGQTMHRFPTDRRCSSSSTRRVERAERARRGAGRGQHLRRVEGRLDVTVLYRIEDPFAVMQQAARDGSSRRRR